MVATLTNGSRRSLSTVLALCSLIAAQQSQTTTAASQIADLGACLNSAGVENSVPTTTTWTTDIEPWNARVNPTPSAVAYPKTEEEVSAALKCAAQTSTKVTTLGGNRSFSSLGFGRNDGALIMNLKNMKVLQYDEASSILTYGGPVMISEAASLLWDDHKRTLPHGRCPDVGMTGIASSGFGTMSRHSGTVLDNIVGVRVALANGSIVDADAEKNPDLYWGVRGAASSMGVVLQFKLKTFEPPSQRVTNYTIAFNSSYKPTQQDNVDLLLGTQKWAQSVDNNDLLSIRFSISTKSKMKGFVYGSTSESAASLASLMKYLPDTAVLTSNEFDFWASEDITTPGISTKGTSPRLYFYITAVTVKNSVPLDNSTAWDLFTNTAYAPKLADATASGFIDVWGGEFTKSVAADTSAWKHDDNLLLIRWDMRTPTYDVSFADSSITTLREGFFKFVDSYKAAGGSPGTLITYRDEKWSIDEVAEYIYGGGNFERLQKIKTEFDPSEMFNTDPQAIPALTATSTHYQVLQFDDPVFTGAQQVRRRYKDLAILVHPDKNRSAGAEAAFQRLSEAYECLVDQVLQREYLHVVCCMLCRRKFLSSEALDRHKARSKLHLANVQTQKKTGPVGG
ncbi:hypothetical protein G195_011469 [Phytophthora kernoviae 00238/432]|uniref:J domain-containing protein n=1 Tax=Phytophthora kernoviae 00238/432 TaxID=1284355 RepID=A0A8J4S0Q5_9STRA|nr:hypothetical protein G195_011469 [Phytophthora kernoviae 00238/432]